jgi:hypothetical protein
LQTVNDTLDIKQQQDASDIKHWRWMQSMIEKLGWDGMSSEESANESDIETTYRPRILEWRRDIDNYLSIIDKEYRNLARLKSRRGPRPALRRRSEANKISTRDPVAGLPICFYRETWLMKKSETYIERTLCPSMERFKWMELRVASARP